MRLSDLAQGGTISVLGNARSDEIEIRGIASDSRHVEPGWLFAALPGARADGRAFIADAVRRGAVAVLAPTGTVLTDAERPLALVTDDNPRRGLARIAARFHKPQPRWIAAVTGTNGKTSVAAFARQIWTLIGYRAASLGTLGIVAPGREQPGSLTTPDPVELHRCLAELEAAGVDRVALEASSHGLDQHRLDGVEIACGGFTNLTRDHLDYHGSMEAYRAVKMRLFDSLLPAGAAAVLNADSPEHDSLLALCRARGHRIIGYGRNAADIRLEDATPAADGQHLALALFGKRRRIRVPLAGAFQVHNALCALGLVIGAGEAADAALPTLERLAGVRGRVELVARHPDGAAIYVDYAHTPDALATVLGALRPHARHRLVVVFGCGGDRDRGKRPQMGRVAERLADRVVVTDDNPRSEDPAAIRDEILAACRVATEIAGRAEAIRRTIAELEPGDLLVIAGKGHETGQTIAGVTYPFDDAEVARAAVAAIAPAGRA